MGYIPKCIKKLESKKKNKCRRAKNRKNKLKSRINPKVHNRVPFLTNKINNSDMSTDNFWRSYEVSQKWIQKHNVVWWKSKCTALENENRILREKIKTLTESLNSEYYPQTADQNYGYINADAYQYDHNYYDSTQNNAYQYDPNNYNSGQTGAYQYDQNNYDSAQTGTYQYDQNNYDSAQTDAYEYDQNNYDSAQTDAHEYDENNYDPANTDTNYYDEDNYEYANNDGDCGEEAENDEDDLVFEVDESMMKFLEQSFRYKMKLKQGQTNSAASCNGEENDTEDVAQGPSTSNINPEVDNSELLYGSASSRIMKMEKSVQISADQFQNFPKPHYWPNIPFH